MKKILALALAVFMLLSATACGGSGKDSGSQAAPEAPATGNQTPGSTPAAPAPDEGLIVAPKGESKVVVDDSEYASMSADELYQAALKEGGKLVVYSETSSTEKSVKGFLEAYPGIEVEVTKKKNYDINSAIPLEAKSGQPYCDIVVAGDSEGSKYYEWYDEGYVVSYIPGPIANDLKEEYTAYGLPITIEGDIWWYSRNVFPDGSPVHNIWDVVERDANGKSLYHLYMHDASNVTVAGMLANLVRMSDEMEAAYKEKYGKDLEYTYDASALGIEENNAGYEWLYQYLQCNYTVITDSDEILATVDRSTAEEPALGFATSLKYGDTLEAGENVGFCEGMKPCSGFAKVKYVYICSNTDNPAAARLFALYSMGGEDGQGKGYDFYVNRNGCYGTRKSHDDSTHSDFSLEELCLYPSDIDFVYETVLDIQDFWTYTVDQRK